MKKVGFSNKEIQNLLGITNKRMGEILNIHPRIISKHRCGKVISIDQVSKISKYLNDEIDSCKDEKIKQKCLELVQFRNKYNTKE